MDEESEAELVRKIALYPGCSLEGAEHSFLASLRSVLDVLGVGQEELGDWCCCGATSAHALDHGLCLALALRNLAAAEAQGFAEILAPCAACYNRLASANLEFREDPAVLARLCEETDLAYRGTVKVRNALDLLANELGTGAVSASVTRPLSGLNVVCYYGCLNTRIPGFDGFDDTEYPTSMDRLVEALGARVLDWSYKTECCGASLFVSAGGVAAHLVSRILGDAAAREADCIAVACPLCHNNLDTKQDDIRERYGVPRAVPVVYITQLMGLALGVPEADLQLHQSFVPFELSLAGV